jgi:RNA polymerase primary sigma factor
MRPIDDDNDLDELDDDALDSPEEALGPAFARLVEKAKLKGVTTVDELNMAISAEQGPEAIEEAMSILSNLDIRVVEKDEDISDENASEKEDETEDDLANLGRTNDPVRMYLREMGIVELLSREGEIAIAKRIEAGNNVMIGGLTESAMTMNALMGWHSALLTGEMQLRNIIDLEATYEADPSKKALLAAIEKQEKEKLLQKDDEELEEDNTQENEDEFEDLDDSDMDSEDDEETLDEEFSDEEEEAEEGLTAAKEQEDFEFTEEHPAVENSADAEGFKEEFAEDEEK